MLYDLTHTIKHEMPVFPGTPAPVLVPSNTLEENGFRETRLTLTSHMGTHMDAPAHQLQDGVTLDQMGVERFCGSALVVDCSHLPGGRTITRAFLRPYEDLLRATDFVLFRTGFEQLWGTMDFYGDFPVPDEECARFLVSCGIKGIGTDTMSVDPIDDQIMPVHHILLESAGVSIENLCLSQLPAGAVCDFLALPLKYDGADGAPVRAVAIL